MKIKSLGYTSVKMQFNNVEVITDPISAKEGTGSFPKTSADVVLFTGVDHVGKEGVLAESGLDSKIAPKEREKYIEIVNAGEYEVGEVFIRRELRSNFYVIDEGDVRIVYVGMDSKGLALEEFKDLGDVDVFIVPIGDGDLFMGYDKLQKVISTVDPSNLVVTGYEEISSMVEGLKKLDEFIKHFGYAHVSNEKTYRISKGREVDNKIINVVVLEN